MDSSWDEHARTDLAGTGQVRAGGVGSCLAEPTEPLDFQRRQPGNTWSERMSRTERASAAMVNYLERQGYRVEIIIL